jgi:hypothetical protein
LELNASLSPRSLAQALLHNNFPESSPVVMVTDHAVLRHFVASGIIRGVVAYKVNALRTP